MLPRMMSVVCAAILLIGTALIYSPALNGPFLFDDLTFIVHDPALQGGLNLDSLLNSTRGQVTRIIGFLTFFLNYRLGGLEPFGYHLFNLVLHGAVAAGVWYMFRKILAGQRDGEAVAFAGAFLFAVHPLQTQAVSYISQRFTVLAALFYVAALVLYLHGRTRTDQPKVQAGCFAGVMILGVLGLFTKEIALTLPLTILLLELFFVKQTRLKIGLWIGSFCLFAGVLLVTFSWKKLASMLGEPLPSESFPGDTLTVGTYVLTEMRVLMTLLRLFVLPLGQNFDHDFPMSHGWSEPSVFLSFAALAFLLAAGFYLRRKSPAVSIGLFWFFLTMSVEFIPRANVIWEHKMYLPSVGLCLAAAAGWSALAKNPKKFAVVMGIVACILSVLTFQRNTLYANETVFWQDVVRKSPRKVRAYLNLVEARFRQKDYNGALAVYAELLRYNPDAQEGYNGRALLLQKLNRTDEAFADYGKALAVKPDYIAALVNRGNLHRREKRFESAFRDYTAALSIEPENTTALSNRGALFLLQKDYVSALADLDRAVRINPRFVDGYINRGAVYLEQGLLEHAFKNYSQALALEPDNRDALYNRAIVYYRTGRNLPALADIEKILESDPDWEPARIFRQQLIGQ